MQVPLQRCTCPPSSLLKVDTPPTALLRTLPGKAICVRKILESRMLQDGQEAPGKCPGVRDSFLPLPPPPCPEHSAACFIRPRAQQMPSSSQPHSFTLSHVSLTLTQQGLAEPLTSPCRESNDEPAGALPGPSQDSARITTLPWRWISSKGISSTGPAASHPSPLHLGEQPPSQRRSGWVALGDQEDGGPAWWGPGTGRQADPSSGGWEGGTWVHLPPLPQG
uniref:Uncharacterized protein LOC105071188 n=1 Tax=Camelus bactrianus TaxID=9837 RepID=A0A9W3HJV7_CAMBA|nr:uncharacterized protein LOC105071188 [Camelus bactrianus]